MAYDKNSIDKQAEQEGRALHKQGQSATQQNARHKYKKTYSKVKFDRLFRG